MNTLLLLAENNPVNHIRDQPFLKNEAGYWIWSAHVGTLILAGILTILVLSWAARRIGTGPESQGHDRYLTKNPFAHMIEVICVYLRDSIVEPMLGARTPAFMPFLWTIFFFILFNNLLGLIPILDLVHLLVPAWKEAHISPIGATPTQNLFVTAVLAAIAFFVINVSAIREVGVKHYFQHLTGGAPLAVAPLVVVIEFIGLFIKPIALAIRLFANMTAGHILLATMFMFVGMSLSEGVNLLIGVPVTLASSVAAILIYFLETFVAFLQAFIFMFLTAVFIAMYESHEHHEEHHEVDHPGDAAPAAASIA